MGSQQSSATAGQVGVAEGNLTAGAVNPAAENWDICAVRRNGSDSEAGYVRAGSSGTLAASISSATIDHGNIITLVTVEAVAAAILAGPLQLRPVVGDPVVVSPRAALPAGLALSHARVSAAGVISVGLANPTAGTINPAALVWDMCVFTQASNIRGNRSGRRGVTSNISINPGSIAAAAVLEVAVNMPGAQIGDVVHVTAADGMDVRICISHARVSANNTVQVGFCNLTVGAVDPAAVVCLIQTFPRVPPL